jgi:diacylglycerol kinase (ATP)
MKPEKVFILANLKARGKSRNQLEEAIGLIQNHLPVELIYTTSAEDAKERAATLSQNADNIVVACGGDGTINSVIQNFSENGTLGIIPSGTANVIARELGIPLNFRDAAKNLLTAAVQKVDVGLCNGRRFLFVAGTGFDAQVAANVSPALKKFLGKFAYHIASFKELVTYSPPTLRIKFRDDRPEVKGQFVLIANMRRYGGDLFFAPAARHDDGKLDLIVLKKFNPSSLLKLFNFARRTAPFPSEVAEQFQAESFTINSDAECPYQLDGETFSGTDTFYFSVNRKKINILTP